MNRKTQKLLLCFGVLFSLSAANTDAQEKFMLLKLNDAETISVNLKEVPQYWLKGDSLFLRTQDKVERYDLSLVQEIIFQDTGYASNPLVQHDAAYVYPSLATDYVYVVGVGDVRPTLYTTDGKQIAVSSAKIDNVIRLEVNQLPTGIYQLKCGSKTFKFIKGK